MNFNCKHDWEFTRGYRKHPEFGELSSVLHCKKCGVNLTASQAAQVELWKNTVGIQKWLAIGAFVIAVASLVVSFLK